MKNETPPHPAGQIYVWPAGVCFTFFPPFKFRRQILERKQQKTSITRKGQLKFRSAQKRTDWPNVKQIFFFGQKNWKFETFVCLCHHKWFTKSIHQVKGPINLPFHRASFTFDEIMCVIEGQFDWWFLSLFRAPLLNFLFSLRRNLLS